MSRVKNGQKWMNMPKHTRSTTGTSKKKMIHNENEDCHKCKTLTHWLFVKYDMSYKAYRRKPKEVRDELRNEFRLDTGIDMRTKEQRGYDEAIGILMDCGVPFAPDGTPLGIGWDG